jgi:hypothetical protein
MFIKMSILIGLLWKIHFLTFHLVTNVFKNNRHHITKMQWKKTNKLEIKLKLIS